MAATLRDISEVSSKGELRWVNPLLMRGGGSWQ